MKDVKAMSTSEIMSYLDAITVMDDELERAVRITYQCVDNEGIDELRKDEILEILKVEAEIIEPVRLKLVKEVTRRFKQNFGISKGPFEITEVIHRLVKESPELAMNKAEIDLKKAKIAESKNLKKA